MTARPSRSSAGGGRRLPILLLALDLNFVFLWPLLAPVLGVGVGVLLLVALAAFHLPALRRSPVWLVNLDRRFRRSERAKRAALLLSSLVVTGGGLEYLAGGLETLGLVEPYSAMRTMLPGGVEDWRLAHLTADRHRQPDPELLWRPVARAPYNRQRFKGPEIDLDKPDGVFRIFCYGDSNTDGPDRGGWTERLGGRLGGDRYEVINAGVTGYSSYQGRLRFARDAPRFRPGSRVTGDARGTGGHQRSQLARKAFDRLVRRIVDTDPQHDLPRLAILHRHSR